MASAHSGAAVCGRNGQRRDLELADVFGGEALRRQHVSGAGDGDEVRQVPQLLMVAPPQDLGHRVGAGDEEQVGAGTFTLEIAQRVDRVGRPRAIDVDATDRELRVGGGRDDRHQIAVLALGDVGFLPRSTRGDEDDLIEIERLSDLTGRDQVTVMDGIERPTHDPDARGACHRHTVGLSGRAPRGWACRAWRCRPPPCARAGSTRCGTTGSRGSA